MSSDEHLSPELSFGYEHGLLSPEELRGVHDHIAACSPCREALAERLSVEDMTQDVGSALELGRHLIWRRIIPYAVAATILLIVGGSIRLLRRGPSIVARSPVDDSPEVRDALRTGRIALPGFLDQLSPRREVLMGQSRPAPTASLSPDATAVLGPNVQFRWTPLAGAWTYRVQVFTLEGEPVGSSPEISGADWTSVAGLSPGVSYEWQVVASRGAERVTLPEPPRTPPRFRLLDSATSERLRALAARRPGAHLLLGVEYGRAGAIEGARAELSAALRQDPKREDVRKLLQSLTL